MLTGTKLIIIQFRHVKKNVAKPFVQYCWKVHFLTRTRYFHLILVETKDSPPTLLRMAVMGICWAPEAKSLIERNSLGHNAL